MGQYLERYLQGECEPVWNELLALGEAIRQEPLYTDAWAVARATMQRVRQNVEVLIPRLRTLGYEFGEWVEDPMPHWKAETSSPKHTETSPILTEWEEWEEWEGKLVPTVPFVPPHQDIQQYLEQLESVCGLLPLSVRAFFLEVGGVNLVGTHRLWDALLDPELWKYSYLLEPPLNLYPYGVSGLDGLYIDPLNSFMLEYYLKMYNCHALSDDRQSSFQLILSPDSYHKMDISGGGPYAIAAPNRAIDGLWLNEWHKTTFVHYLRICFHYGGLPGLVLLQPPLLASHQEEIAEALAFLRQDLLPI